MRKLIGFGLGLVAAVAVGFTDVSSARAGGAVALNQILTGATPDQVAQSLFGTATPTPQQVQAAVNLTALINPTGIDTSTPAGQTQLQNSLAIYGILYDVNNQAGINAASASFASPAFLGLPPATQQSLINAVLAIGSTVL